MNPGIDRSSTSLSTTWTARLNAPLASLLMKLSVEVETTEGRGAIQRNLNMLRKWAHDNLMEFSKAKCKLLQVGWSNPRCVYRAALQRRTWMLGWKPKPAISACSLTFSFHNTWHSFVSHMQTVCHYRWPKQFLFCLKFRKGLTIFGVQIPPCTWMEILHLFWETDTVKVLGCRTHTSMSGQYYLQPNPRTQKTSGRRQLISQLSGTRLTRAPTGTQSRTMQGGRLSYPMNSRQAAVLPSYPSSVLPKELLLSRQNLL